MQRNLARIYAASSERSDCIVLEENIYDVLIAFHLAIMGEVFHLNSTWRIF